MESIARFYLPGGIFALSLLSGVWLWISGKPLNGVIFTIHKLIALVGVVLTVIRLQQAFQANGALPFPTALLALAGVCVLALFASGAMMSIGKPDYNLVLMVHRVTLAVLVIAAAAGVYLLLAGTA